MQQSVLSPAEPSPPSDLFQQSLGPQHMLTAGNSHHVRQGLWPLRMQVQAVTDGVRCRIKGRGPHSLLAASCPL